jgi:hypothetical protein
VRVEPFSEPVLINSSALENLLTTSWVEGDCEEKEVSNALDNEVSVSLKDKPLYFTLSAASLMEVGGETVWTSAAQIKSGFSVSVLLEKKEVPNEIEELCCTKPAGFYATKTFHPIYTTNDFMTTIGLHLKDELSCCFPSSQFNGALILEDNDRDILIGDEIPPCETTINHGLIKEEGTTFNTSSTKLSFDSQERAIVIEGGIAGKEYIIDLISVDGRYVGRTKQVGNGTVFIPLNYFDDQLPSGIYFINVFYGEEQSSYKIFLP